MSGPGRVVVTGMGVVSPLGRGLDALIKGIAEGKSGVRAMPHWNEYKGLRSFVGAPAELEGEKSIPRQKRRSMSPMSIFTVQAAEEAMALAGLSAADLDPERTGCIVGSTMGSSVAINQFFEQILPDKNIQEVPAMMFFKCMAHTAAANLSQYLGLRGTVMSTAAACASGLQAVGTAYRLLSLGEADIMFSGGAEELHPTATGSFDLLWATSTEYNEEPWKTPRPFDAKRDGLVCGEGAGILLLETLEHARARGAEPLCEITGYASYGSGEHVSHSDPPAMERTMLAALSEAGLSAVDIGYINAHATATLQGDRAEAEAIASVAGDGVPVSSLKGYMGHTLGASGAIELAASIKMMTDGMLYGGLNLEEVAPDCRGIQHLVEHRRAEIRHILKNCFAFGGINASMVCSRMD